jgi:small conductance mechanosensitive channel
MNIAIPDTITPYIPLIQGALLGVVILVIGWLVSKWSEKLVVGAFRVRKLDEALGRFLGGGVRYSVLAATIIAALGSVGIETTSIVAVFASAGLAVGLALQGSLSNFASGVLILFFRPFELGDKVTAGGHTGAISDIGIFVTTMMTLDNEVIIIPNSAITGGSIINHTAKGVIRGTVEVGVHYGADVAKVTEVLLAAAKKAQHVRADPGPEVAFVNLGASSLDFHVRGWTEPAHFLDMLGAIRTSVYNELNAAGIEIPFQQIVIHKAKE